MKNYAHDELMKLASQGYLFCAKGLLAHHCGGGKYLDYLGQSGDEFIFGAGPWFRIKTSTNLVSYQYEIQVKPVNPNKRSLV